MEEWHDPEAVIDQILDSKSVTLKLCPVLASLGLGHTTDQVSQDLWGLDPGISTSQNFLNDSKGQPSLRTHRVTIIIIIPTGSQRPLFHVSIYLIMLKFTLKIP